MSNPVKHQHIMASFWYTDNNPFAVKDLTPGVRVMELSKNIRSGHDLWWNDALEECRVGRLSEHNFCYLHGFPTTPMWSAPIEFWYEYRDQAGSPCTCPTDTRDSSKASLRPVDVCKACLDEKHRRCRWHQQRHGLNLDASGIEEVMFLTLYHNAVFKYVQYRTINWAKKTTGANHMDAVR